MALPAASEVFKGSIDESLKKLVQPAAVVPASVFVLLNLAVVYPRLLAAKVPLATTFDGFTDEWKVAILAALILVIGYVMLNLTGSAMRLATGELIAYTPIGSLLTWFERRRIANASRHARDAKGLKAEDARLPPPDHAAPTRLGNVLAGANESIYRRYGFDMAALWAHLRALLVKDEDKLATALDEEYTGLQVLINLALTVLTVGAEAATLALATNDGGAAVAFLLSIPLAYGFYRSACARARSYTDLVEVAVDMYRSKVGEKLGVKVTDDPAKDKPAWEALRDWLLWDARPNVPVDPKATLSVSATTSDNVTIKALPTTLMSEIPVVTTLAGSLVAQWPEEYWYLLSGKVPEDCCDEKVPIQVVLSAGKEWQWADNPRVQIGGSDQEAAVVRGGAAGDSLLIRTRIRGVASTDLHLAYPRKRIEITAVPAGKPGSVHLAFGKDPKLGAEQLEVMVKASSEKLPVIMTIRVAWMTGELLPVELDGASLMGTMKDGVWSGSATLGAAERVLHIGLPKVGLPKAIGEE
jgi:hypothetical protein